MSPNPQSSIPWAAYRGATAVLESGAMPFLRWRMRHGKEDPVRLPERLGRSTMARPAGSLVWLHGASVGESLALLPLIERLRRRGLQVLLTTGTVSSSRILRERLPAGAVHQFVPLDGPRAAQRFLDHWQPDLVIFTESELWPNLLGAAKRRRMPTVLVNARMSARSFARWSRLPTIAEPLIGSFDLILAQTDADAARYTALSGRAVQSTGNLKFDAAPPPADPVDLAALRAAIAERPTWIAASTHAGEDEECCAVHARLKGQLPNLLTIIVPRRIQRGPELLAHAAELGLTGGLRSRRDPITTGVDIHIADTMGEVGLFYRLAAAVFVGKSLGGYGGGQNPIEPAKLGNAVLHGPHTANFEEVYAALDQAGGGLRVQDGPQLVNALTTLLTHPSRLTEIGRLAASTIAAQSGATDRALDQLAPFLPAGSDEAAS